MGIRLYKPDEPIQKRDVDELYISSKQHQKIINHLHLYNWDIDVTYQDFSKHDKILFELNRIQNADHVIIDICKQNILDLGFIIGLSTNKKMNVFVCLESIKDLPEKEHLEKVLSFHDIAFYDDLDELLSIWFSEE